MRARGFKHLVACLVGGGALVALLAVGEPVRGAALATIAASAPPTRVVPVQATFTG